MAHRDLKPPNILVTPGGRVKILDFGIAKVFRSCAEPADGAKNVHAALTPSYASPEQLSRGPSSLSCDIYSMGAVLYKILTGRPPHDLADRNLAEAMRLLVSESVARSLRAEKICDIAILHSSSRPGNGGPGVAEIGPKMRACRDEAELEPAIVSRDQLRGPRRRF